MFPETTETTADPLYMHAFTRVIVIGASSGGLEPLKNIVKDLPPDFECPVFIVWHMSADVRGVLPNILNKLNTINAAHAYDKEPVKPNRIYIAPPDHHMLLEDGVLRVTRGPKENRFRPAVDPLFRSAAFAYKSRVVGIILSGALDDGTAGLWSVKQRGGITVVQDPLEAEVPSMPENALREVEVDYKISVADIPDLLVGLSKKKSNENRMALNNDYDDKLKSEVMVAGEKILSLTQMLNLGELSPFTCPECHGVLTKIKDGNQSRFRCHTGHAFSADTLLASITEKIEESLYSSIRGLDECILLLNNIGDHFAEANDPKIAAIYFKKAKEAKERADQLRNAALNNEQLSKDKLFSEAGNISGGES